MGISEAFNVARSGLQVTERTLHTKSANIAMQGATAGKKQYHIVTSLPSVDKGNLGTPTSGSNTINPTGIQMSLGVQSAGIYSDFSPGEQIQTDNPLDLYIDGDGFLEVTLPDGRTAYTRVGVLQLNANNEIVMPKTGYVVSPGIVLPATTVKVNINPQGQVVVETAGSTTQQVVGQFQTATFFNPSGLRAIGDSMYLETAASGTADSGIPGLARRGVIKQGYREGSNVNAVEEMTDLIQLEKIYDMLTKVLKTGDAMLSAATQVGR
jgi:flagellar basal-body rod protein FlgG